MRTSVARIAVASAVLAFLLPAPAAQAGWLDSAVSAERRVRSMPLERRPNRIGHVYGNNMRRIRTGRLLVNYGHYERPVARYLYLP